jgi:hypothetical protein
MNLLSRDYYSSISVLLDRGRVSCMGYGDYVWSMKRADPEAVTFFKTLLARFMP